MCKMDLRPVLAAIVLLGLAGCATWSTSNVAGQAPVTTIRPATMIEQILVTEGDAPRAYTILGDISVTVNKTTLFHPDPTREMVEAKLKEEASKLGADAVIQVRYGTPGISLMSWGSLDGKGRAIAYNKQ